jgi:predicted DNA-binding protein (UPF0251 family)
MTQAAGPITLTAEQHREEALTLRLGGLTYREIASKMGLAVSTVHEHVQIALKEIRESVAEKAVELRDIEVQRSDAIIAAHWARIGEVGSAGVVLRAMQRRADLLGIDAAKNLKIGGDGTPVQTVGSGIDLSKLSTEELLQLEGLTQKARSAAPPASTTPDRES